MPRSLEWSGGKDQALNQNVDQGLEKVQYWSLWYTPPEPEMTRVSWSRNIQPSTQ